MKRLLLCSAVLLPIVAGCGNRSELRVVSNLGSYDICEIYAFPDSAVKRGQNLLEGRLQPGEEWTIELDRGDYHVIAIDEDDDSYDYRGLPLDENGYILQVKLEDFNMGHIHSGDGTLPITIQNGLVSRSIYFAYASRTTGNWGQDMLRTTVMMPEELLTIWVMPGEWNLQLEDQNGSTFTRTGLEIGEDGYFWRLVEADSDI